MVTRAAWAEEGAAPATVQLSLVERPALLVGDRRLVRRAVVTSDGTPIDPAALTWQWEVSPAGSATVSADGSLRVTAVGEVTITGTASNSSGAATGSTTVTVQSLETVKTRATYWTDEKRAAAADNIANLAWARSLRDNAVAAAEPYLAMDVEQLWKFVPSQDIPRSYGFTSVEQNGCLNCGTAVHGHGQYPYTADVVGKPWKVTCPNCRFDFPTNDFAAYYAGGLDENGLFDADLAKAHDDALIAAGGTGNLVNLGHPEKGEGWGVDNGAGTRLANGARYTPIAYYAHWSLWHTTGILTRALRALVDAYLYTGDPKYAGHGVVILDRVADVYPSLNLDQWTYPNGYLNSNGNSSRGKAIGSIWETGLIRDYVTAYDAFFPALADGADRPVPPDVLAALDRLSHQMDKTNPKRIRRNIEDGLLRSILPAVKRGEIRGNNGMHQATLAAAAVVLDHLPETKEMLDFNFATGTVTGTEVKGGNLGSIFVNQVDRDGNGDEAAPGYNSLWLGSFTLTANYLDGYRLDGLPVYDLYANPKYLAMFDGIHPLTMLQHYTPTIGDTGSTGNPVLSVTPSSMLTAFVKTGEPIYAQVLHALNNNSTVGLRLGVFDREPDAIAAKVQAVVDRHGPWRTSSQVLTGYGFAALRDGEPPVTVVRGTELSFSGMTVTSASQPTKYFESNGTVQFEATTVGDHVAFDFSLASAADGWLSLGVWTAGSYGIYQVKLDGVVVAERFSFAGGGGQVKGVGPVSLAAGAHRITFTLVEATPGPKCGLRTLIIGPEQPGEVDLGTERGTTLYFGRNTGHGHRDTLNLGHFAFGMDLLPDMGYPRYANSIDMHRVSLVINTISHNTVVVDDAPQSNVVHGFPQHIDLGSDAQVVEVEAEQAYGVVDRYRRAVAQVRIDEENSYLVDFFRVRGGTRHLYSFHAMEATAVVAEGVELVPQKNSAGAYVGTYAGPAVRYDDSVRDTTGFSYFFDVDRARGSFGDVAVTWRQLKDTWNIRGGGAGAATDVDVRLTLLGDHSDVALASCEPPQNKPGNPKRLRYLLAQSAPHAGASLFTGVVEAYRGDRQVQSVVAVPVTTVDGAAVDAQDVRAVRVTLPGDRVDLVVHALDPSRTVLVDGLRFRGRLGVLTRQPGRADRVQLFEGTEFAGSVYGELAALTGTVTGFTTDLSRSNELVVSFPADEAAQVDPADLVGRYLFAADDGVRNAVYRIDSVRSWSATSAVLGLGHVSPIRSYVDAHDFSRGFVHDLAVGRAWRLPLRRTEPTDPVGRLRFLLELGRGRLDAAGGRNLPVLVDVASRNAAAGRTAAARDVVTELVAALARPEIRAAAGTVLWPSLDGTARGWLRQLGG